MIVRRFRKPGIVAFRQFLAKCRETPATPYAHELLQNDSLTAVVSPTIEVESKRLSTKADAAHYLKAVLDPLAEQSVAEDAGLWTWLTLFFFDSVCPLNDGCRSVKNDYYYIFKPKNPRHFYRHLLFISWRILQVAPHHNRLFLGSAVSSLDKVTTEVMKRLYLTRIPCIFEVLDRLYWDENRRRPRAGITDSATVRPGDLVHRLPIRIRQLEKTYDLFSLSADQLLELLGDEFRWDDRSPRQLTLTVPS